MARSSGNDPLTRFSWIVSVPGFTRAGFVSCGVPGYSITPKEYRGLGHHLNPKSIIESTTLTPVSLTRGVTNDTSFAKWASGPWDLVQNNAGTKNTSGSPFSSWEGALATASDNGAKPIPSDTAYPFSYRRDVKIEHTNRAGQVIVIYTLYNAYPIEYKPASDFSSADDNEVSMESLVLSYEGFDVRYTGVAGFAGTLATGLLNKI
jgi:phage tail-like protein